MKQFKNIFVGFLIGAGAILPGISSGVFCVIFGIYDKLINSILGFFKNIKKNIAFLLPIGIGSFLGVVFFGKLLKYLFSTFPIQTNMVFIGFILGSVPKLFHTANQKNRIPITLLTIYPNNIYFIYYFIKIRRIFISGWI